MKHSYPVTEEHYRKYRDLQQHLRVKFNETTYRTFGFGTFGELFAYQQRDKSLSNLPPAAFRPWVQSMRVFNQGAKPLAEFELICLAKHCLLTQTLGLRPQYIDKKKAVL